MISLFCLLKFQITIDMFSPITLKIALDIRESKKYVSLYLASIEFLLSLISKAVLIDSSLRLLFLFSNRIFILEGQS